MRTFIVSYDLAPTADKRSLVDAIMSLGEAWARPLESLWYVRAEDTRAELEARIARHLGADDGLLIQEARGEAAMLNTGLRWFRRRRREDSVETATDASNVVAFPMPVPHAVTEVADEQLPFVDLPEFKVAS
jgi:hypothetical protein